MFEQIAIRQEKESQEKGSQDHHLVTSDKVSFLSCQSDLVQEPIETILASITWDVCDPVSFAKVGKEYLGEVSLCTGSLFILVPMIQASDTAIGVYRKLTVHPNSDVAFSIVTTTNVLQCLYDFYNLEHLDAEDLQYIRMSGALSSDQQAHLTKTLSNKNDASSFLASLRFNHFLFGKTKLATFKRQQKNIYLVTFA